MTIYTETMTFIEEFEEYLRDNKDEYKEGEIDDENFDNELKEELTIYVSDLSNRDNTEIIVEYGINNAMFMFQSRLINVGDEEGDVAGQLAYQILYENIRHYYDKIKKDMYRIWNE